MISFKRQLILSFGVIIASVAVATVAIYIVSGDIASQVQKIQADRALINQNSGALDVVADLRDQVPQADSYAAAIDQLLPNQDGLIGFSNWLDTIAAANQVSASASFAGGPTPPSASVPGELSFSLQVSGSLANITTFLNDIEAKSPGFLLEISSFNIVPSGGNEELTAQGNVFFRP